MSDRDGVADLRRLLDGMDKALDLAWEAYRSPGAMGDLEAFYWGGVEAVRFVARHTVEGSMDEYAPTVDALLLNGYESMLGGYCEDRVPAPSVTPGDFAYEVSVHVTDDDVVTARFATEYEALTWALHKSRVHRGLSYEVRVVGADD